MLNKLSKRIRFGSNSRTELYLGSQTLAFQVMFSPVVVGRAFMKIGVNALRRVCGSTDVNLNTFPEVYGLIMGTRSDDRLVESQSGFVSARDLESMACARGEHQIWIMRNGQTWVVKIAFFGGRIGGIASFVGLSAEEWNFADIRFPVNARLELLRKSPLYVAGEIPVQTKLFSEISPSIKALNSREGKFFVKRKKR